MKLISRFWDAIKTVKALLFGELFRDEIELKLDERDVRVRPAGRQVPPREEWAGEYGVPQICCPHASESGPVRVTVQRVALEVNIPAGLDSCRNCFEEWLNRHAATCASCGDPILPGCLVAEVDPFASPPFTHMRPVCCGQPSRFCGVWGEGRLISLHEMHPDDIPSGTRTLADHARRLGRGQPWFEDWDAKIKPN